LFLTAPFDFVGFGHNPEHGDLPEIEHLVEALAQCTYATQEIVRHRTCHRVFGAISDKDAPSRTVGNLFAKVISSDEISIGNTSPSRSHGAAFAGQVP
jgi:hypothetical protein